MICIYAIVDAGVREPLELCGLEDRPLEILSCGTISAAFTAHATTSIDPSKQNLLKYEQTMEQLMQARTLLPARFGTCFVDQAMARQAITAHHDKFVVALHEVRGCVEMGLRTLPASLSKRSAATNVVPMSSGRAYMNARLARQREEDAAQQQAEQAARRLHHPLAERWRHSAPRVAQGGGSLFSSAYLVPRRDLDDFRSALRDLAQAHPEISILCTGPWPPYHFTPKLSRAEGAS